ncbi:MAG: hypothetical protein ACI9NT_001470 [Bacteroidia bacterium]|jgi:hypothetical protein
MKNSPMINSPTALKVVNGLLFNVSWFTLVMAHNVVPAPVVAAVHLAVHFALMGRGKSELLLIILVGCAGALLDQALFAFGVFLVDGQHALPPLWLSCLWPVFATTLLHAFSGFHYRPVLALLLGAVGGTTSYVAGASLSDVSFADPFWGPVTLAVIWGVLFPLMMMLARRDAETSNAPATA